MIEINLVESDNAHANEIASAKSHEILEIASITNCVNEAHNGSKIKIEATPNNSDRFQLYLENVCCKHFEFNIQMQILNKKKFVLTFGQPLTSADDATIEIKISLAKVVDESIVELNGPDHLRIHLQGDAQISYRAICGADNEVSSVFRDKLESRINHNIVSVFNSK